MRTTLTIDDDVLAAARQFADARGMSLGEAVSQLARATLTERRRHDSRNGILLLPAPASAGHATSEDVDELLDDAP